MIDHVFAKRLWNGATIAGLGFVALSILLIVTHIAFLGSENNLGFGPFASLALLVGVICLVVGGARALRVSKQPPN